MRTYLMYRLRLCFRLQLPTELCSGRHPAADRSQDEQNSHNIRASHIYLFNFLFDFVILLWTCLSTTCRLGDWKPKLYTTICIRALLLRIKDDRQRDKTVLHTTTTTYTAVVYIYKIRFFIFFSKIRDNAYIFLCFETLFRTTIEQWFCAQFKEQFSFPFFFCTIFIYSFHLRPHAISNVFNLFRVHCISLFLNI